MRDLGEAGADGPRGWLAPARGATWPTPGRCAPSTAWPWRWTARRNRRWSLPAGGSANLSGLARLAGDTPRWRAQPGVPLAVLAQAGLRQFDGLPGAMTLAEWLAAPAAWPAGRCAQSGVLAADVVLADGVEKRGLLARRRTAAALGHAAAAGAGAVPAEHGAGRRRLRRGRRLGRRYRLDALRPQAPATVNLAHLLLGHGGTLAWVQEVLLTAVPAAGKRQAATRRRWTMRPGRRDAGWMPGSRRCSTRMVVSLLAFAQ